MPKVNDAYFEAKRDSILDAALRVCLRKPLHEISMKDIIQETGLSQGGIYRYYEDIDDVLAAVINRFNRHDIKPRAGFHEGDSPEKNVSAFFSWIAETMESAGKSYGKIVYELNAITAGNPARRDRINARLKTVENPAFALNTLFEFIEKTIDSGHFKPCMAKEKLFAYIIAALDGIFRDWILIHCYDAQDFPYRESFTAMDLTSALAISVLSILQSGR